MALLAATIGAGGALVNATPATADATEVGGGAAGLEIRSEVTSELFNDELNALWQEIPLDLPAVVLPPNGSPKKSASLYSYEANGVSAHLLRATTQGNLQGTPYAKSTASVAEVEIPGTSISAVRTECTWDLAGARATTTIVDVNGTVYSPPPNTEVPIPGGYIVLNEQEINDYYIRPTDPAPAKVINVKGVHVYFESDVPVPDEYTSVVADIAVAFSSCDPLNIPGLSGLKLQGITT